MAQYKLSKQRKELLLFKTLKVREILNKQNSSEGEVFSVVIDMVFIVEQIVKIKLSEKNFLLIYKKLPENSVIKPIINYEAIKDQKTLTANEALNLFKIFFPRSLITKNSQSLELLIEYRNELYHHIVPFKAIEKEKMIQLARTVYSTITDILKKYIGPLPDKQDIKSTLTQEEIFELFKDSVQRKIRLTRLDSQSLNMRSDAGFGKLSIYKSPLMEVVAPRNYFGHGDNVCPRCGNYSFKEVTPNPYLAGNYEPYFECSICHLELTPEEYKIAKKILEEKQRG